MCYYPIQIPYLLNQAYLETVTYTEEVVPSLRAFVVCFWEAVSKQSAAQAAENVIVTDGCIDLIVNLEERNIGFCGMSKTDFQFRVEHPSRYLGARMMPGAFHQLTGLPATAAMDQFLPISTVFPNFDEDRFFTLPFQKAKAHIQQFFAELTRNKKPDLFTALFDQLSHDVPHTTTELYEQFHLSPRQCQRLFRLHFGLRPKQVLSILRFQRCLTILKSGSARPSDVLNAVHYYDQPHLIRDFKENIGITPLELIQKYQS